MKPKTMQQAKENTLGNLADALGNIQEMIDFATGPDWSFNTYADLRDKKDELQRLIDFIGRRPAQPDAGWIENDKR